MSAKVVVQYRGRLGNNLFQFAVGWTLARKTGVRLVANAIDGIPGTQGFEGDAGCERPYATVDQHSHHLRVEECLAHLESGGQLVINGFHQRYELLRDSGYKDELKRLLRPQRSVAFQFDPADLVAHVRIGDYFHSRFVAKFGYPLEDVRQRILCCSYRHLWVASDSPHDAFVRGLQDELGATVVTEAHPAHVLSILSQAPRLVMTPSSFSWWGGWLGCAKQVFYPLKGVWANRRNGNDLWVDDEPRYERY